MQNSQTQGQTRHNKTWNKLKYAITNRQILAKFLSRKNNKNISSLNLHQPANCVKWLQLWLKFT